MWIQLLRLMQLKMNKLHFLLVHDTSTPFIIVFFSLFWSCFKLSWLLFHVVWSRLTSLSSMPMICFWSQVDFTSCGGLLCIAAVLLMILGIVTAIVLSFQYVRTHWSNALIYSLLSCFSVWGVAAQQGVSVGLISHSKAFVMSPTGPLAAYAVRCNWSHHLHSGESALTWSWGQLVSPVVQGHCGITRGLISLPPWNTLLFSRLVSYIFTIYW